MVTDEIRVYVDIQVRVCYLSMYVYCIEHRRIIEAFFVMIGTIFTYKNIRYALTFYRYEV